MAGQDAVVLRDVRFRYATGPEILHLDDMRIRAGRSVFLHGPSGSGKSTLLAIIGGILVPQKGTVAVFGQETTALSASARDSLRGSTMGFIFQRFSLIPYLSIAENISLPCRIHPARLARMVAPTLQQEVMRLAQRLELAVDLNARVTQLSVGQQQRVAIARALIGSPPLIIADEPTSSLDPERRDAFLNLLTEMTQQAGASPATLLFVSHDGSLAKHFDSSVALAECNSAREDRRGQPC